MLQWPKWLLGSLFVAALAGGGFVAWMRSKPVPATASFIPPELPASVSDPELREGITKAREQVIAEPGSVEALHALGWIFLAHGLHPQSNACFAEAAKHDPSNPQWPYLIGTNNILFAPDDVLSYLRTAYSLAKVPDQKSTTRLQLAEALLDRNELSEAEKLYAEEFASDPNSVRAHYGMGMLSVIRGDPKSAVQHLKIAVEHPSSRRKAAGLLASCYRQLDDKTERERYEKEAAHGPDDPPWPDPFTAELQRWLLGQSARQHLVNALQKQGRSNELVLTLAELARSHPDEQALVPLGLQLTQQGKFTAAEKVFRTALTANSGHVGARCLLGMCLYLQAQEKWNAGNRVAAKQQFEEALIEFRRSMEEKPDLGMAHLHAALTLTYLNRLPEAVEICRVAIQVIPQNAEVHLAMADALAKLGKPDEAIPHLENALRLDPENARAKALLEECKKKKS